ncbi:MAG TPA: DUF2345 domain-containing protein, partial [Burkholderiaceae bacterium]|nr:DUF2345 domain-containing protein [Burkholderiaceae bacterium]
AWGAVRAGQGLLITSYGTAPREPAGDATAAQALMQQVRHLAQLHDRAATTHQTVALSSERGSPASGQSALSSSEPPLQALETALNGQVDAQDLSRARADAAQRTTQGAHKLPHSTDPVVAVAARAGLVLTAGRDVVMASSDTIHSASGRDTSRAAGGAQRLHTGQAIGVLAGAQQPGTEAQGRGITMVAAQGDVQVQAQSDTLQIAAKGRVNVQSAHSHLDWAAAKKITLKTSQGASIAIEAGGITVQCPGKITVKAATKSMVGASTYAYSMNAMQGDARFDEELILRWPYDDAPIANRRFEVLRADGTTVRGRTDANGRTGLQKSDFLEQLNLRLLEDH